MQFNGYKDIHSPEYVKEVNARLENAVKHATNRPGKVDKTQATVNIKNALNEMKTTLEKGKALWQHHHKTKYIVKKK